MKLRRRGLRAVLIRSMPRHFSRNLRPSERVSQPWHMRTPIDTQDHRPKRAGCAGLTLAVGGLTDGHGILGLGWLANVGSSP
jgi:hypothetical protein